jgi:hypothetical protein
VQAQGAQPGPGAAAGVGQVRQQLAAPTGRARQRRAGVHHHGAVGAGPDGEVDAGIAGIVEAALAEARHQRLGLAATGQVAHAVAGQDVVEAAQVRGHGPGQGFIRGRAEHAPALRLVTKQGQHAFVVGQVGGVDDHPRGDLALQARLAAKQPDRQRQQQPGASRQQGQRRLQQQVRAQQGAVEVDAQRAGGRGLGLSHLGGGLEGRRGGLG